jgi:uncharacterized membrane protein
MNGNWRARLRWPLALFMVVVGALHFLTPEFFVRIVPDYLPAHLMLVWVSGVFEMLGGVGLLVPRTRRLASYGLVALYVAVFPANVNMLLHPAEVGGGLPLWVLWVRLPLQAGLIAWALYAGGGAEETQGR